MKLANRLSPHLNGKPQPPLRPNGYGDQVSPPQAAKGDTPAIRDPKTGQFGKGNVAAIGHVNPTARARAELQKALVAAVSPENLADLAQRLLADAKRGSVPSAELLLRYVIGRPVGAADPDRVSLEGRNLIQSWPLLAEFGTVLTSRCSTF